MWTYVPGNSQRKAFLLKGIKRVELEDKAREMGISRDYLRERLKVLSIDDALNPDFAFCKTLARPNSVKDYHALKPTFVDGGNLYKFMKALSLVDINQMR